jgi:hypothetical protein
MALAKSVFTTFLRSLTVRDCQEIQEDFDPRGRKIEKHAM